MIPDGETFSAAAAFKYHTRRLYQNTLSKTFNTMESYNDVINSANVVLVEFFASWCPHCQRMMPVVDDIRQLLEGRAKVYQFDIDENRDLASRLGVEGIPTFIVYKDGAPVWTGSGEMDANALMSKIESYL